MTRNIHAMKYICSCGRFQVEEYKPGATIPLKVTCECGKETIRRERGTKDPGSGAFVSGGSYFSETHEYKGRPIAEAVEVEVRYDGKLQWMLLKELEGNWHDEVIWTGGIRIRPYTDNPITYHEQKKADQDIEWEEAAAEEDE